jgi:hypothetical protein
MRSIEKINPLNVAGVRKFKFLPPHITYTEISLGKYKTLNDIDSWIEENLSGRYWTGTISKLQDNKLVLANCVAFEEATELTLFLLGCPHL